MKKIIIFDTGIGTFSESCDDWYMKKEDSFIHTEPSKHNRPRKRYAIDMPLHSLKYRIFNIKVWGRHGWNS